MKKLKKIDLFVEKNGSSKMLAYCVPSQGETLLNILNFLNEEISQSCAGNGSCGTCRYYLIEHKQNSMLRTDLELEMATDRNFLENEKLACQTIVSGNIKIKLP